MGIFDGINIAESAMSVHRFRSEVAAENIANVHTPGWRRKEVTLRGTEFATQFAGARASHGGSALGPASGGSSDARAGAVRVAGVSHRAGGAYDERQEALMATTDMIQAKSAFELNSKAATLLKSMALSSLEIGRGS